MRIVENEQVLMVGLTLEVHLLNTQSLRVTVIKRFDELGHAGRNPSLDLAATRFEQFAAFGLESRLQ